MKDAPEILAFNRGLIDPLALARIDLKRTALSAEVMTNWLPRTLGPMTIRPGTEYIEATANNVLAKYIPFIFSVTDVAIIECTENVMRVLVDEELISRVSVSTAVANGLFDTDLTSWTDSDEVGTTSAWATGGYMSLTGTGINAAIREQTVTVAAGDQNKEHALRITVYQGDVVLRVGSSSGDDDYITETSLYPGTHSLAFTPTGDFYIQFFNRDKHAALVESIEVESAGVMEIPTTWDEDDLSNLRYEQSGDVVFVACAGQRQRRIERRATRSWSYVKYMTDDGPFRTPNTGPIRLSGSAVNGNITLSASKKLFRSTHVGALFTLSSSGQTVAAAIAGADQWSDSIRVAGVSTGRNFTVTIAGSWAGTVRIQRSVGAPGAWTDVAGLYWVSNATYNYNDTLDNQIIYYRIGIKTGEYTSGTANVELEYGSGSIIGTVRVTGYTSATAVSAEVLKDLGNTDSTLDWSEGAWSDRRGWPTSVGIHEGRMWWAGKDKLFGSVSDSYAGYDPNYEGDAGPISRSIGAGPVDTINWLLPLNRMIVGGQAQELSAQSSSIDEPLTPNNFRLTPISGQGSAAVPAVVVDNGGAFVQRNGYRVYGIVQSGELSGYSLEDFSTLVPSIGNPGIVRAAVQRQPDTRLHFVRSDGTVAILIFDKAENVRCWCEYETDGEVVDVIVLPGSPGDSVYYGVKRIIGGVDKYYLEKWACGNACIGGTTNLLADCFIEYDGVLATAITGLDHLEGKEVVVWGNEKDLGTYTVVYGSITLSEAVTYAVIGLGYTAQFKGTKLAHPIDSGSLLSQRNRIDHIGLILQNTHSQGLRFGPDFDTMDDLPLIEDHDDIDVDEIREKYNGDYVEFPGEWSTDSRLCLEASAPRPCTILAAIIPLAAHQKS